MGEKPHKCKSCGTSFTQAHNLKTHRNDVHTKAVTFSCAHCSYVATRKSSLVKHIHTQHVYESARSLASKVALRDERIAALQEASEAEKIKCRRLEDRVEELQKLLAQASTDKHLLQDNVNRLKLQLQTVSSGVEVLNAAITILQKNAVEMNARYKSLQEEQKILLQQLDESKQLAAEPKIKNDETEVEFQDMLKSHKNHEAKRLEFETEAYTQQLAVEKMEKKIKELEEAQAKQQVQIGEDKLVAERQQQILSANQLELRASKTRTAEMERLASDAIAGCAQYEEQIWKLQKQLVSVRRKLSIYHAKCKAKDMSHKKEVEKYMEEANLLKLQFLTSLHKRRASGESTMQSRARSSPVSHSKPRLMMISALQRCKSPFVVRKMKKPLVTRPEKPEEVRAKVRKGSRKKVQNPIKALSEFYSPAESVLDGLDAQVQ